MDSKSIRSRESKLSLHKKAFFIIHRVYKKESFSKGKSSLRLSKNYASAVDNRAAGEREGARPASQSNNPPQKSLIFQAFWAKQRFE